MVNAAVAPRKITAFIRGDLSGTRSYQAKASRMATYRMTGQSRSEAETAARKRCNSAEAVVGDGKRALKRETSPRRRAEHRKGKEPL
jgi:hypothetical protein